MMPDLSYSIYQPWVVQMPVYTDPYGKTWGGSFSDDPSGTKYEAGGGELVASFNPTGSIEDPLNAANLPAGATRALDSGVLRDKLWRSRWKAQRKS